VLGFGFMGVETCCAGKCASPGEGKRRTPEKAQYLGALLDAFEGSRSTSESASVDAGPISAFSVMLFTAFLVFVVVGVVLSVIQVSCLTSYNHTTSSLRSIDRSNFSKLPQL